MHNSKKGWSSYIQLLMQALNHFVSGFEINHEARNYTQNNKSYRRNFFAEVGSLEIG